MVPLLLAACFSTPTPGVAPKPALPEIAGTFSGTSFVEIEGTRDEIGSGRVVLRADRSFEMRFDFTSVSEIWDCSGTWEIVQQVPGDGSKGGYVRLLLDVRRSKQGVPTGKTSLYVGITDDEVMVSGGPCLGFTLPRTQ